MVIRRMPFPRSMVWDRLADVATHHTWMHEAQNIEFVSAQQSGVGTVIDVTTRIGPFSTRDRIEFTTWIEPRELSVRHKGAVSGTGTFTLAEDSADMTTVTWTETLTMPWQLGGRLGDLIARPIVTRIWRRNLANLEDLIARVG